MSDAPTRAFAGNRPSDIGSAPAKKPAPGTSLRRGVGAAAANLSGFGIVCFLFVLLIFARLVYPGFFEAANLQNILSQNAPIGLVAIGMTIVMIGGGFDLSVGAIAAVASVTYAMLALNIGLWQAAIATLALGLLLGAINGVLVGYLGINPFIATLATASIYSGFAFVLSDSQPIVVDVAGFEEVGQGTLWSVPISVWIVAGTFLVGGVVLARSVYGHNLYAVGGNSEAARLSGIRINQVRIVSYVSVGVMSALAGIVLTSRLGVGQADVGLDMTLNAITIVVIGGTSLFGGEGAMWRTTIGLLLLGIIINIADSKGWSGSVQGIVKGLVLIGAVGLDVLARSMRARKQRFD